MTRFIGEAVGQRSGRSKGTSAKDLRKEMEGKLRIVPCLIPDLGLTGRWSLQTFRNQAGTPNLIKLLLQSVFLPYQKGT